MPILSDTYYTVIEWPIPSHVHGGFIDVAHRGFREHAPPNHLRRHTPILIGREEINGSLNGSDPEFAARVVGPFADCRIVPVTITVGAPLELVEVPPIPAIPQYRLP